MGGKRLGKKHQGEGRKRTPRVFNLKRKYPCKCGRNNSYPSYDCTNGCGRQICNSCQAGRYVCRECVPKIRSYIS